MKPSKQLLRSPADWFKSRRPDQLFKTPYHVGADPFKNFTKPQGISSPRRWASSKPPRSVLTHDQPRSGPPFTERPPGRVESYPPKRHTPTEKGNLPGYRTKILRFNRNKDDGNMSSEGHDISPLMEAQTPGMHRAVIALGSNVGDRIANIENALESMRSKRLKIVKLSKLYETTPLYYENQGPFLNGTVLVETDRDAFALLDLLQEIENELGRTREIEKGPRTLDLDIILYDKEQINHERLKVPHPLLLEREFVLRPLADIIPDHTISGIFEKRVNESSATSGPTTCKVGAAFAAIPKSRPMFPVTYLSPSLPFVQALNPKRRTHIMSVLNITPDSFSDGGVLSTDNLTIITDTVKSHISSGATILDIGGQSTRPHADLLSPDEELARILPVLRHIKHNIPEARNVAISIDTFHAPVVRACAEENLFDIVNDVSAGTMDPEMLRTVARVRKTIILMHMRGTPATMNKLTSYPRGLLPTIGKELAARVKAALNAGIPPWRIMLDPGIGFAKTMDQNLLLLKAGSKPLVLKEKALRKLPWVVGTSRKGFIGKITGVKEASERVWGTAACVTAAVAGGADVVRVHDVEEMRDVVSMAEGIWRRWFEDEGASKDDSRGE